MRKGIRETKQDRIFNGINRVFMILIFIIFAWPLWFVVAASFSDPNAVTSGQVWFWPVSFHTGGYVMTFEYRNLAGILEFRFLYHFGYGREYGADRDHSISLI